MNPIEAYGWRVGRWSHLVGKAFIRWLDRPPGLRWLDVGCGAGALSSVILEDGRAARLIGIDPSVAAIELARSEINDARADFRTEAAEQMSIPDASIDVVVSGLCLNFIEHPLRAMSEMARVTVRGGCIAGYVWDFAGEMQVLCRYWDAAIAVDGAARTADQGSRFPLCRPASILRLFTDSNLAGVEIRPVDVMAQFPDFDTYWQALTTGDGSPAVYAASISENHRTAIRNQLQKMIPLQKDGSFGLMARAWAARGTRLLKDKSSRT